MVGIPRSRVEHELVAGAQAGLGQREAAEPVALPRIGAGEEERDVVVAVRARRPGRPIERAQVLLVARAGRQVDVEVGRDALERVVAGAVQRQRERVGVRAEDLGGAVALVDVAVDDQRRAATRPSRAQPRQRSPRRR